MNLLFNLLFNHSHTSSFYTTTTSQTIHITLRRLLIVYRVLKIRISRRIIQEKNCDHDLIHGGTINRPSD